jgi:hypothetical protein
MRIKMFFNHQETAVQEAVKMSPLGATTGLTLMNVTIPELIQYLTLAYTVLLVIEKAYMFYRRYRDKNESKE